MLRTFAFVMSTVALVSVGRPASADVGPPDKTCTVDKRCPGKGVECRYVNSQPDAGELQCAADAESRGMDLVCSRGGGTAGVNIYCPKGTGTKPSGCAAAPADARSVGGVAALALVVAVTIRRARVRAAHRPAD